MMARGQKDSSPGFSAPSTCPNYPGVMALLMTAGDALTVTLAELPVQLEESHVAAVCRTVVVENSIRTHAGRGPPANLLS